MAVSVSVKSMASLYCKTIIQHRVVVNKCTFAMKKYCSCKIVSV